MVLRSRDVRAGTGASFRRPATQNEEIQLKRRLYTPSRTVALIAALALSGCGADDDSGGDGGGSGPPFTESRLRGDCPGLLFVGGPTTFQAQVKNIGKEDWPATFVASDDLDPFVVNLVSLDGATATDLGNPIFDTYRLPGLRSGEEGRLTLALNPKEAGNFELNVIVWGDAKDGDGSIPNERPFGCSDVAIQP